MCTDKWRPTASLLSLPRKKAQEVICSYVQNEAQMDHLKQISWLSVAILNVTLIALRHYADWRKKEDHEQFIRFRLANLEQFLYTSNATVIWGSLYELL